MYVRIYIHVAVGIYTTFPRWHRPRLTTIERLNSETKRCTEVDRIVPDGDAIVRVVGALLLGKNDEGAVQRSCCMTLKSTATMSLRVAS